MPEHFAPADQLRIILIKVPPSRFLATSSRAQGVGLHFCGEHFQSKKRGQLLLPNTLHSHHIPLGNCFGDILIPISSTL